MKILCEEQYTPEWYEVRRGKISASAAGLALARVGGKGRNNYIEQLADDIEGVPNFDEAEPPPWFTDGRFYESFARGWYAYKFDVDVIETGFVVHDDYGFLGCSPDGLIGDDGLVEIKYRKTLKTFKQHAALRANNSVMAQAQTQMYVCDRKWCDYVNYWRDDPAEVEKGFCERIERDDAYIENTLLPAFKGLMDEVLQMVRERKVRYSSGDSVVGPSS